MTVLEIWSTVSNQWRFSFNGPEALDVVAIEAALRIHDIEKSERKFVTAQLLKISDIVLDELKTNSPASGKDRDDA
jgi:hypothetical protein